MSELLSKKRHCIACLIVLSVNLYHAICNPIRLVLLSSSLIGESTLGKDLSFLKKYFHLESVYVLLVYFLFYKVTVVITNPISCCLSEKKIYS